MMFNNASRCRLLLSTLAMSLILIIVQGSTTADQQQQKSFKIYHSLGETKPFVSRGTIRLSTTSSSDSSKKESTSTTANTSTSSGIVATIEHESDCLTNISQDMDDLISNNGFYRIKIVDNDDESKSVLASVPGCEVRRANFREEIALSIGQTGSLLSLSYIPLVSPLAPKCDELPPLTSIENENELSFTSTISYSTSTPGMALPKILPKSRPFVGVQPIRVSKSSNTNQQGGEGESTSNDQQGRKGFMDDDEKAQKAENQSFLRKYWYVILPVAIMTFTGSPEEPPPKQQQSQQQATGQNAASIAPTSTAAPSSGAKQRRGKRG
mmetsp:Transcript_4184/g.4746  ORF Transcript_4184/g.4746 Transcript_4184/m.4746 type:complete len:325 (-) Transcript_4184:169-1143(-)